jgi:hypothetical protein
MVALRFLIIAACSLLVVACGSNTPSTDPSMSIDPSVPRPGEPSMSGLQNPPDMWTRPGQQTASLPAR